MKNDAPLVMVEEYWANTHLSVVRYTGMIGAFGHEYIIVDKNGIDIYALSERAHKEGRDKAIAPGEPCDLCRTDFVKTYRKLGRDWVIKLLREKKTLKEIKEIAKKLS